MSSVGYDGSKTILQPCCCRVALSIFVMCVQKLSRKWMIFSVSLSNSPTHSRQLDHTPIRVYRFVPLKHFLMYRALLTLGDAHHLTGIDIWLNSGFGRISPSYTGSSQLCVDLEIRFIVTSGNSVWKPVIVATYGSFPGQMLIGN